MEGLTVFVAKSEGQQLIEISCKTEIFEDIYVSMAVRFLMLLNSLVRL